MGNPAAASITGTDSFQLRLQKSELLRAKLMLVLYVVLSGITFARRLSGGVVMANDLLFTITTGLTLMAAAVAWYAVLRLREDMRLGKLTTVWWVRHLSWIELAWPSALMTALHYLSPGGDRLALSAPVLLMFPLTVLMSVLRMRPWLTVFLGLAGAAFHLVLVYDTYRVGHLPGPEVPRYVTYAALLAIHGVAGGVVSLAARRYLKEAVDEALSAQAKGMKLDALERDLETARKIQQTLLPAAAPAFAGYDIAGMNRPADQTGGDYYDWQTMPDGRLLVAIADVTGHGIGPALVMAVCRAYTRASASTISDPSAMMHRLNTLLSDDLSDGRFITLAMAVLAKDGEVEFMSAGHGPSVLLRKSDGSVRDFGGDGLPLAVFADSTYDTAHSFTMHADDILVLLTDGVIEWPDKHGEQFGPARLLDVVRKLAHRPAIEIMNGIDKAVRDFTAGSKQLDDFTIVVIRRLE